MATNHFQSLSPDLMLHIFHACDNFSDIVALASCCKTTHAAWLSSAPMVIWNLAPTIIVSFDRALMAVRATKIVLDAQRNGTEPPQPFPVRELSGHSRKPVPQEIKAVFDFEHLAKCVVHMMSNWRAKTELAPEQAHLPALLLFKSKVPNKYGWRHERLYRRIYNILLTGAVCSRPYTAPFVRAQQEGRTDFLERCAQDSPLTDEDFAFLKLFPVYNYRVEDSGDLRRWRDAEFESLFGELGQWLVDEGGLSGLVEKLGPTRVGIEITDHGWNFQNDIEGEKSSMRGKAAPFVRSKY